jgi:hypothetical protein
MKSAPKLVDPLRYGTVDELALEKHVGGHYLP